MLLSHQVGCQTFYDIRTVGGVVFPTYHSGCGQLGLLGDDKEWTYAFDEASVWASAEELRFQFVHMLLYCEFADPLARWTEQWRRMCDEIMQRAAVDSHVVNLHVNDEDLQGYNLYELEVLLNSNCNSSSLSDYGLLMPPPKLIAELKNRLLMEERNSDRVSLAEEHEVLVSKLNPNQQVIYESVMKASLSKNIVLAALRAAGKIILVVASSGIASILLPSGRTAHSCFKIPLDVTDDSICHVKKQTQLSRLLLETTLIIWDEAPMNDQKSFEALDKTLRDILDQPMCPFCGKSVLLGEDFRQTLPIKLKGTKMDIITSSIAESSLWRHFKICKLSQNIRHLQPNLNDEQKCKIAAFSLWLLHIGDRCIGVNDDDDLLT